ncbi:uncharacterized protein C8A04DRAFT_13877 [Dichotomopilus funicola]|uniref:ATP-grasp domain-containing protein n=1 Tax=Dichotomopilus funicola TaxID=1934379 RepID=A0AAN6ZLJ9_9PEZI|nr:hypothetical protein C8A04DRAFT_13877 [Dichotomopilus funicola]
MATTAGQKLLLVDGKTGQVTFEASWKAAPNATFGQSGDPHEPFVSLDLLLEPGKQQANGNGNGLHHHHHQVQLNLGPRTHGTQAAPANDERLVVSTPYGESVEATRTSVGSSEALQFLEDLLKAAQSTRRAQLAKLIIPSTAGYIARSDIVSLRLKDSEHVESVATFAAPRQYFAGGDVIVEGADECCGWLSHLLRRSAAGIILRDHDDTGVKINLQKASIALDAQLHDRLSFPWLTRSLHPRRTLAIIEAGRCHPRYGGTGPSVYGAAKALGIDIVAMDNVGHWMDDPEFRDWRMAFVPLALHDPPQEDFEDRIVATVRSCGIPIDGLLTLCESYMNPVARACQRLGFPTENPAPYLIATNKYETSVFEGHQAHLANSADEAVAIASSNDGGMPYPLIIKPCNGWSSEGVSLVHHKSEIRAAVDSIDISRHGTEFVMEPYCAGPEVDVNLVMLDGELLFFEVCDDMPKTAEDEDDFDDEEDGTTIDRHGHVSGARSDSSLNTFIEMCSVFPSSLPRREIEILRDSFHASLLRLGFRTGMFHLEGRIQNSTTEYAYDHQRGVVDLRIKSSPERDEAPQAWLIEINPRPPGMKGSLVIESTWGVDYWATTLLSALRDDERLRALSQPFASGPQYTCAMVFIPTEYDADRCEGIFDSDDIVAELFARRPDLARHVSRSGCLVHRGQKIPHPARDGYNSFLAWFNVFSRTSRTETLRLAAEIRKEVRYQFR